MACGSITSVNEALWVLSSFFPPELAAHKRYKFAQTCTAFSCLTQFLALGSVSNFISCRDLFKYICLGDMVAVRMCLFFGCVCFFAVTPFVQIPLWWGARGRLLTMLAGQELPSKKEPSPETPTVMHSTRRTRSRRQRKS